jgi:transcription antitermination factor NusG
MIQTEKFIWYIVRMPNKLIPDSCNKINNALSSLMPDDVIKTELKCARFIEKTLTKYNKNNEAKEKIVNDLPGYMFLQCSTSNIEDPKMSSTIIEFIEKILKILYLNILGSISNSEFENMLANVETGDMKIQSGAIVVVEKGAFQSMKGVVMNVNDKEEIAAIELIIFGKKTNITLPFQDFKVTNED